MAIHMSVVHLLRSRQNKTVWTVCHFC